MQRLVLLALAAVWPLAVSAEPVVLMVGAPEDRHATFTFSDDRGAPDALVIETLRAGNPGAAIRIWIDKSPLPLLDRLLTADDCSFDDAGAMCRIEIAGGTIAYDAFVQGFKRGLSVHVEIGNAGVMEMQDNLSLSGFTAAYEG